MPDPIKICKKSHQFSEVDLKSLSFSIPPIEASDDYSSRRLVCFDASYDENTFNFINRSQLLTPGKEEIIVPQADLRITNVALGEQLSDANGRSVVKLTYTTLISVDNTDDDDDDEQTSPPITSTILCSLTGGKV